jgi:hypothetical protein
LRTTTAAAIRTNDSFGNSFLGHALDDYVRPAPTES